jgi:methionyl aminopeptidase
MARPGSDRVPTRKGPKELAAMADAGRIVAAVLDVVEARVAPGVSTGELDELAERFIREQGGKPSFKGLYGYPATICSAPNDVVVHSIPSRETVLSEGDILGIDVGVAVGGLHADGTRTFPVGAVGGRAQRLLEATREALDLGIAQAIEGATVEDISRAIETHVVSAGYSIVRELTGHGIGRRVHEPPSIPNFVDRRAFRADYDTRLRRGMTLAIEPMVAEGGARVTQDADGWTYRTADGKLSAHFEHTVAVTRGEPRILTASSPTPSEQGA